MHNNLFWFFWLSIWPVLGVCGPMIVAELGSFEPKSDIRFLSANSIQGNGTGVFQGTEPKSIGSSIPAPHSTGIDGRTATSETRARSNRRLQSSHFAAPLPVAQVSLPRYTSNPNPGTEPDLTDSEPLPPAPSFENSDSPNTGASGATDAGKRRDPSPVPQRATPKPAVSADPFERHRAKSSHTVERNEIQQRIYERASQQAQQRRARLANRPGGRYSRPVENSIRGFSTGRATISNRSLARLKR